MTISAGSIIDDNDFLDSGTNAGTSADNGKVAKLELVGSSNGRIAKEFLPSDTVYAATKKIEVDATEITHGNSLTETTLFDVSIPGGSLSTNNAIRAKIYISNMSIVAGQEANFLLKYGATTICTLNISNVSASDITAMKGTIELYIIADGATNAQKGSIQAILSLANAEKAGDASVGLTKAMGAQNGTAAEDSTANKTLTVSLDWGSTGAGNTLTAEFWVVELITG